MTELQLYKFCQDKELDWRGNELIIWINFYDIDEFTNLVGCNYLSDSGIEVRLQHSCIAFDLVPICEYYDIEPTNILEKED